MKVRPIHKGLVIAISLGVILMAVRTNSANDVIVGTTVRAGSSTRPAKGIARNLRTATVKPLAQPVVTTDAVSEWNQNAVTLTLLPASALAPVQQTRVMAIVQVSVHDAVNGITGEYATYLSPGPAPVNASPEAAAIAAAHHALRNLFGSQAGPLDTLYFDSLAAHGLSADDPGIAYGQSAA